MHLYETHLHTQPASGCARWSAREAVEYYKNAGYAGIFITNHFLDEDDETKKRLTFAQRMDQYFADYEEGVRAGKELGLPVFCGIELSYYGTDFLIYGLDKAWYVAHPEIENMIVTAVLTMMVRDGALVIHAHPFREGGSIDHIRLYPRSVHGVEIDNANRTKFENDLAKQYAQNYGLLQFAGSDHHGKEGHGERSGVGFATPVLNEKDFVRKCLAGEMIPFHKQLTPFCRK